MTWRGGSGGFPVGSSYLPWEGGCLHPLGREEKALPLEADSLPVVLGNVKAQRDQEGSQHLDTGKGGGT